MDKKYLTGQGISDNRIIIREEHSETVEKGKVIRTDPATGLTIQDGKAVTLYVSLGPEIEKVKMPNVVGWSLEDAKDILVEKGFDPMRITPVYVQSNEPENEVLGQSLERNVEVDINSEIILEVSLGPTEPPTTVPPTTTTPPTTVPPTTVPPTTVPPTTVPQTTAPPAVPEVVSKTVTFTIKNPPAEDFTLSLVEGGDFAISDLPLAGGTTTVTVTLDGYGVQYYEFWIDGIFTEQIEKVDFTG